MARGWSTVNSWDFLLEADPMTLSSSSRTRTVSFIIMSSWDMAFPSHTVVLAAILFVLFVLSVWSCDGWRIITQFDVPEKKNSQLGFL